jgi:hypothetical protein
MNPNPASANPIQKISRDSTNQEISGLSLTGDVTQGGRCTESQSIGRACLEFVTPDPKVITFISEKDKTWSIWNQQKGESEFLKLGQIFLSNIDGRKNASAKVQSLTSRSLTLEITPLKATDSNFLIDLGPYYINLFIIVNENATPKISLNCPHFVTTFEKDPLVVKIQSNIPVDWQDYMDYGQTSWGWDRELNSIDVSVSADKTLLQLVVKPKIVSSYQETIRLTASSILNNPYSVELPKVICDIKIKNSSKGRVPVYKAFWRDGSQSSARQFTADNLSSAYIIVQFSEKNSQGKTLKKNDFSQESRRINVDVWDNNRQWIRQFDRALNTDFEVGFDVPVDIFNCRSKCSNRTEKIRLSSQDGSFAKEFQITLTQGFFDFTIQIPAQVEWGKKYKASIKANKSINGICSFYSYYRGNIYQGSSRMTNGAASKFVEFYWGDVKSTTVQLEVICKAKGFTVSNIAYVRAFRR